MGSPPTLGLFHRDVGAIICSATPKKNPKQLPCLGFLVNKQFGSNRLSDVGGGGQGEPPSLSPCVKSKLAPHSEVAGRTEVIWWRC